MMKMKRREQLYMDKKAPKMFHSKNNKTNLTFKKKEKEKNGKKQKTKTTHTLHCYC